MSTALLKTQFHNAVADAVYKDIVTRNSNYYYFLGKTLPWSNENTPEYPIDNIYYENLVRSDMISAKLIKSTDVSYVVPRYNWISGQVYDQYDDQYDTRLKGIDLRNGGSNYTSIPQVYIGSFGAVEWISDYVFTKGELVKAVNNFYAVTEETAQSTDIPTHIAGTINGFTSVYVSDGNGIGATAIAHVDTMNHIGSIELTSSGSGYTSPPSVNIFGSAGTGAIATAVITKGHASGTQAIETAKFYVMTNEFKVFKCIDNNLGGISTAKPINMSASAIKYSDGYIWKFMYVVPPALRNKFLSDDYLPVTNALKSLYYSSGEINTIRIESMGSNYTYANILIQGNGFLESDPIYITNVSISNGGTNYTTAALLEFDPPFSGSDDFTPNENVTTGGLIQSYNNIYEVVLSGNIGTIPPNHLYGIVQYGDCTLKYKGSAITGVPIVENGVVNDLVLSGKLQRIELTQSGSGYLTSPTVNLSYENTEWTSNTVVNLGDILAYEDRIYVVTQSGTTDSDADNFPTHTTNTALTVVNGTAHLTFLDYYTPISAISNIQNGVVTHVNITHSGSGLTVPPTVTFGTEWTPNTEVIAETQLYYNDKLYTVVTNGTTGDTGPIHSYGSEINGDTELVYAGYKATGTVSLKYGSGYSVVPNYTVLDVAFEGRTDLALSIANNKSDAILYPILNNGQIVSVVIVNPGIGYTYANMTVLGDGTGAKVSTDLSYGDINSLQSTVELLSIPGQINRIAPISGGYSYSSDSTTVTIVGNGTGATATPIISNGRIVNYNITQPGQNYTWANIIITGSFDDQDNPISNGASARAIISPSGGHGKNALNEFFARKLMFYSNISSERNQGFNVNNDYRQLGILKGPTQFDNDKLLFENNISACWAIGTDIVTTGIEVDDLLYNSNMNRFRVVAVEERSLLLQSLDDVSPQTYTTLQHDSNLTLTILYATPPEINKYSGDLLFIDNKVAFTPTSEQLVILRTVVHF